jgi:hypothetical protein
VRHALGAPLRQLVVRNIYNDLYNGDTGTEWDSFKNKIHSYQLRQDNKVTDTAWYCPGSYFL